MRERQLADGGGEAHHTTARKVDRARICNRFWSLGIDSEKSIPSVYVARRAGTKNRVVVLARQAGNRLLGSSNGLQIRAQVDPLEITQYSLGPRRKYYFVGSSWLVEQM